MEDNRETTCKDMVYKRKFTKQGLKNFRRKCWLQRIEKQTLVKEEQPHFETELQNVLDIKVEEPEITCSFEEDHHAILLDHSYSRIAVKIEPDLYDNFYQLTDTAQTSSETASEAQQVAADESAAAVGGIVPIIKVEIESDRESDVQCLDTDSTDDEPVKIRRVPDEISNSGLLTDVDAYVDIDGTGLQLQDLQNGDGARQRLQIGANLPPSSSPATHAFDRYNVLNLHNYAKRGEPPSARATHSSARGKHIQSDSGTGPGIPGFLDVPAGTRNRSAATSSNNYFNLNTKSKNVRRNQSSSSSKKASNRFAKSSFVYVNVPGLKPIKLKVQKVEVSPFQNQKEIEQMVRANPLEIKRAENHLKLKAFHQGSRAKRASKGQSSHRVRNASIVRVYHGKSGKGNPPSERTDICSITPSVSDETNKSVSVLRVKTQEELNASVSSMATLHIAEKSKDSDVRTNASKVAYNENKRKKLKTLDPTKNVMCGNSETAADELPATVLNGRNMLSLNRQLVYLPDHIRTKLSTCQSANTNKEKPSGAAKKKKLFNFNANKNTTIILREDPLNKAKSSSDKGKQFLMKSVLRKYTKMCAPRTNLNLIVEDADNIEASSTPNQIDAGLLNLSKFVAKFPPSNLVQNVFPVNSHRINIEGSVPLIQVSNPALPIKNPGVTHSKKNRRQRRNQYPNLSQWSNESVEMPDYIYPGPSNSYVDQNISCTLRDPLDIVGNTIGNASGGSDLNNASGSREPSEDDSSTETADTETSSMFEQFESSAMPCNSSVPNDNFSDTRSMDEARSVGTPNQFQVSISQCVENIIQNLVVEDDHNMEEVDVLRVDLNEWNQDSTVALNDESVAVTSGENLEPPVPIEELATRTEERKRKSPVRIEESPTRSKERRTSTKRKSKDAMRKLMRDNLDEDYVEKRSLKKMQAIYGTNLTDIINEGLFSVCKFCKSFTNGIATHLKRLHPEEQEVVDLLSDRKRTGYDQFLWDGRRVYDSMCMSQTIKEIKDNFVKRTIRDSKDKSRNSPKTEIRKSNRNTKPPKEITSLRVDIALKSAPLGNISTSSLLFESNPKETPLDCERTMRRKSLGSAETGALFTRFNSESELLQDPLEIEDDPLSVDETNNDQPAEKANDQVADDVSSIVIEQNNVSVNGRANEPDENYDEEIDISGCVDFDDDRDDSEVYTKVTVENTEIVSSHTEQMQKENEQENGEILNNKSEPNNDDNEEEDVLAASRKCFCKFCKKVYINLKFHLHHVHGDEEEVKKLAKLPKNSLARKKLAEKIRRDGTRIFNHESNYKEAYLYELKKTKENIKARDAKKYTKCPKCSRRFKSRGFSRHVTYCGIRNRKEYAQSIDADMVFADLDSLNSQLRAEFSQNSWLNLAKCLLTSLHVINPNVVNIETVLITDFNKRRQFNEEEDSELKGTIDKWKIKNLFPTEVSPKVILQKDLDGMSVLLTRNQEEGIDLLLKYRLQANVPKGSPYIFGSPVQHKETHVTLVEAMKNYMQEEEYIAAITSSDRKLDDCTASAQRDSSSDTSVISESSPPESNLSLSDRVSKFCPVDCFVQLRPLQPEDFFVFCKSPTSTSSRDNAIYSSSSAPNTSRSPKRNDKIAKSASRSCEIAPSGDSLIDLTKSEESTFIESESEESEFFEIPYACTSTPFTTPINTRSSILAKPATSKSGTKRKRIAKKEKKSSSRSKRSARDVPVKDRRESQIVESPISVRYSSPIPSRPNQFEASPASVDLDESSSNEPVLPTNDLMTVKSNVKINSSNEQSPPPVIKLKIKKIGEDQVMAKLAQVETSMPRAYLKARRISDKKRRVKRLNLQDVILCGNCGKYYARMSFLKHRKFCVHRSILRKRKSKATEIKGEEDLEQEDESSNTKCPTLQSPGGAKKYFCIFCKQTFTKLSRHLEHIHKDEEEVQEMLKYPKGSRKRNQILYKIRTRGTFTFNMNSEYNGGQLIVSRRPNPTLRRTNGDFLPCPYCGNYFAKKTLYRHTKRCSNGQGYQKNVKKVARAIISSVHPRSNKIMATQIIPRLIDDKVSEAIKSDELLVLLGNHLTQKHAAPKGRGYIRQNLRMVGKLLLALKAQNSSITEFSSIFNPDHCDLVIKTVMEVAGYVAETNTFKLCDFARKLGSIVKICGEVWSMECCKNKRFDQRQMIVEFLNKFGDAYKAEVYSKLKPIKPQAKPVKPSGDLKKLFQISQMGMLETSFKLNEDFALETWVDLVNFLLLHLRLLNNNILEDGETLYVSDYLQRHSLDADEDSTFYHSLGLLANFPKNYSKVRLRGTSSYLLLSQEFCGAVDVLLENREDAGVPIENAYLFGKPDESNLHYRTGDAKGHLRNATSGSSVLQQEVFVPKSETKDIKEVHAKYGTVASIHHEFMHYEVDLRKAFDHHITRMLELRSQLSKRFSNQVWIDLIKCVLTCVQLMNDKTFTEVVQYLLLDDYGKRQRVGKDEIADTFNSLTDKCVDFPENYVKINLQGTPINLLLSSEICNTLDLLIRERSSASIDEQNPYVFGCSGNKYNYYRTEGCIGSLPVSSGEEILSLRSRIINDLIKNGTSKIDLSKLLPSTKQDLIDNATRVFYYSQSKMVELKFKLEEQFSNEIWLDLMRCLLSYIHLLNDNSPEYPERLLISDYRYRQMLDSREESSTYYSSSDDLRDFPQNYLKVKLGGSPYYILLSLEFCETVDLLLKYRQDAGVHPDNAYVFGCRGSKENFFRAHGAIAQLAPRCGVRCIKYFKAKVAEGVFSTQEQTVEAKLIPKIEKDAYFKRKMLEQTPKQMDASGIKTEESNSSCVQRRRWTDEEMDAARREFQTCMKQGYLPSMYQCQQVISENAALRNRTPEQLKAWINNQIQKLMGKVRTSKATKPATGGKQVARCRWSTAEQEIVRLYMGDYLMSRTLPSSAECRKMIASNPEMSHRTSEHVRAWINNQNKKRNNL